MKSAKSFYFIGIFVIFFASCTVEKRMHLSGYHIEWKNKDQNSAKQKSLNKEIAFDNLTAEVNEDSAVVIKSETVPLSEVVLSEKTEKVLVVQTSLAPVTKNTTPAKKALQNKIKDLKSKIANSSSIIGAFFSIVLVIFLIILVALIVIGILLVLNPSLISDYSDI
jgi:hypothetical protein